MPQARAATEVEAANLALSRVRQPPIGAFAENNTRARQVRLHFGGVRDSLLAEHDWKFATDWIVPAAGTAPDTGPWANRYPLPENVVAVRLVQDLGADSWTIEAAPSGELKALVTNTDAPLVKVTVRIASPALWEPLFLDVFELRLAAKIAPVILKSNTLAANLNAEADAKIALAKRVDAKESAPSQITRCTSWTQVRRV